ncbi:hypothetical protein [Streptomyces sp. NPDC059371]|uniref:hypothetical protein n=1 Tax=Streptomyces sp. NPDC059371 TaxID=3346812 RepID=UPI003682B9B5
MFDERQLLDDGRNYTFRAMQAYLDESADMFGLQAGVATERIAKACLVRRSPALLAELQSNSFSSLAALLGLTVVTLPGQRPKVRTVGLQVAFARLQAIGVQIDASRESLEKFIEARNWSTHGGAGEFDLEETAANFVKIIDSLLADLHFDRYSFWHVHLAQADRLKNGAEQRHRERVHKLLADAAQRFKSLSEAECSILQTRATLLVFVEPKHRRFDCPACGNPGLLSGEYVSAQNLASEDGEGIQWAMLEVEDFLCYCCELRLNGRSEIHAGNVQPIVTVTHDEAIAQVYASDPDQDGSDMQ